MKHKIDGKLIVYGTETRRGVLEGINAIADAIKVTLGPRGKTVLIEKEYGYPHLTKDGVTVARSIRLSHSLRNMGTEMIRNVAAQTVDKVGDGTTTSAVIAQKIANDGFQLRSAGLNPVLLRKGITEAKTMVLDHLDSIKKPVDGKEDLRRIAYIASNADDEIADVLSDAFDKVGRDGVVTIEDGVNNKLEVDFVEGLRFDSGYITPLSITNTNTRSCEYKDCYVMVHEKPILNLHPYLNLLSEVLKTERPLLIIAENVDAGALSTIGVNAIQGKFLSCPVRTPGKTEDEKRIFNSDIAAFVGGSVINQDLGLIPERLGIKLLGQADKVIVTADKTIIIGGDGKKDPKKNEIIDGIINGLREKIEDDTYEGDKDLLRLRLGMLTEGIATVKVGGASMLELRERKDRVEDAYFATMAAYKGGVVPGGGIALLRASQKLAAYISTAQDREPEVVSGIKIIQKACEAPILQIIENTGLDGARIIVNKLLECEDPNMGYDANTCEIVNMYERGIIDPVNVVKAAMEDAVSAGSSVISLEAAVLYEEDKNDSREQNAADRFRNG
jgi:chaperonin GroEL